MSERRVEQNGAGLCVRCEHVKVLRSGRGSTFFLCQYSERDPRFPKYPRLPVLQCDAFSPSDPHDAAKETR